MFPVDFKSEGSSHETNMIENAPKWKQLFQPALEKVQKQVHPNLSIQEEALEYIESLILQLLAMLSATKPHSTQEVASTVARTFPKPIDAWALKDAQQALEKGKKKNSRQNLQFPVDRIYPLLKDLLGYKVDYQVALYMVAVLEYISADILKLAGNYVKGIRKNIISREDIEVSMCTDKVLTEMFNQTDDVSTLVPAKEEPVLDTSYEAILKILAQREAFYLREINMIVKVFKDPLESVPGMDSEIIEKVFSNILELRDLSVEMLSLFEDVLEMNEEANNSVDETDSNTAFSGIGGMFLEIAESASLKVYTTYAEDLTSPEHSEKFDTMMSIPGLHDCLSTKFDGFPECVKYVLPKLLLEPIYHCRTYFDVVKLLNKTSKAGDDADDADALEQASAALRSIEFELDRLSGKSFPKKHSHAMMQFQHKRGLSEASINKINEIQKSIEGWADVDKSISQCAHELIMEGSLGKVGKKLTERHVFLFDGLIVCCKRNAMVRRSVSDATEYRLKEKFNVRKIAVHDRDDTDVAELKHSFEIETTDHQSVVLYCKTAEEKSTWMAALISLQYRSTLVRLLDAAMLEEERSLKMPDPEQYRFAIPDSNDNIVFENSRQLPPLIKGGTLHKLVERLTYHMYADTVFVRLFMITYRSFCTPQHLLQLLIERYEIPDPVLTPDERNITDGGLIVIPDSVKKYRKDYVRPVQLRVMNVLRHWVNHHFYDYENNPGLKQKLSEFSHSVKLKNNKACRKYVEIINKNIHKQTTESVPKEFTFATEAPPIETHIERSVKIYNILTLHPIEIARQLTILESEMFRAIKPSELIGAAWTKDDKKYNSPNLLRMIRHSTTLTQWIERCCVEAENFEERVALVSRLVEILVVFEDYNNFNGILEIVSALTSAAVHRLELTFRELGDKKLEVFEKSKELGKDHYKKYQEKLRSINPPCVPFLGMYLTNILHTEEGNPDFLPNDLINFSKRRKVAAIIGEIQEYQNTPYCLKTDPDIRKFFEELDSLQGMTEKDFNDYLYEKSLDIEPRYCRQPPRFPRKSEYSLKSPGIKPTPQRHMSLPGTLSRHSLPGFSAGSYSYSRITEDDNSSASISPRHISPPSPLSPCSPSETSMFQALSTTAPTTGAVPVTQSSQPKSPVPPPIPPRTDRRSDPTPPSSGLNVCIPPPKPQREPLRPPLPPRTYRLNHPQPL